MKDFIKFTFATVVGLLLTTTLLTIIGIVALAGMIATEGMSTPINEKCIMRLDLSGSLNERSEANPFAALMGEPSEGLSLEDALTALKKAATNENIEGIYMRAGGLTASPATAQELRQALVEFKKSGKWIVSYADNYGKMDYYLASVADTILLNPEGSVNFNGMATQLMFYKDVLEKVGVKMQVFKVGTYKSAVEPYIATEMSAANREQMTSYLFGIWNNMLADVSQSRGMTTDQLNAMADSITALASADVVMNAGLVDKLCYIDEVKSLLRDKCGLEDDDEDLVFASVADVANSETLSDKIDEEVAIYYAYGEIVDAGGGFAANSEHRIVGDQMVKDLQELRDDDDIKAVVIRVNSPGGSAYASEQIWHEVELLKAEKPVVVSMGGMAASGGYYISCAANRIFAEPTTLTGSIGIFGLIPDASELMTEKIGVKFDIVKTNEMADFGTMARPFNKQESAQLQKMIERGYDTFTKRVADGRGISQDSVKVIGEGRVWTGEQGLQIGLVDELGNLDAAVAHAAKLAEVEEYRTVGYPAPAGPFDQMKQQKDSYLESSLRELLGDGYAAYSLLRDIREQNPIQARLPYELKIR